jgi:hypothetical protein
MKKYRFFQWFNQNLKTEVVMKTMQLTLEMALFVLYPALVIALIVYTIL